MPREPRPRRRAQDLETVEAAWKSFETKITPEAGEYQRREMKWAFYAGAWWVLNVPIATAGSPDVDTGDWIAYLERLRDEIERFVRAMPRDQK